MLNENRFLGTFRGHNTRTIEFTVRESLPTLLRMRENHSVRLQMADLLGGCEFCHGFYEKYGLNFCSISQNSC